jgi:hypothetical protein
MSWLADATALDASHTNPFLLVAHRVVQPSGLLRSAATKRFFFATNIARGVDFVEACGSLPSFFPQPDWAEGRTKIKQ